MWEQSLLRKMLALARDSTCTILFGVYSSHSFHETLLPRQHGAFLKLCMEKALSMVLLLRLSGQYQEFHFTE